MRGAGEKVHGDAVQSVNVGNLGAAVAGGIGGLRTAASGDGVVAATALERIVDARLDLDALRVVQAVSIEQGRHIDVGKIGTANIFDRTQRIGADRSISGDGAGCHIDTDACRAGGIAVIREV